MLAGRQELLEHDPIEEPVRVGTRIVVPYAHLVQDSQILCAGITLNSLDRDIAAIEERIKREKEAEDERQRIKAEAAAAAAAVEAAMLEAAEAEGEGEESDPSNQSGDQRIEGGSQVANPELMSLHGQGTDEQE